MPQILDRQFLIERCDGDEALLGQVIALFLQESPRLVAKIEAAIQSRSPDSLHEAAHALTGSLGIIGAKSAISLVRHLSAKGRAGVLEGTDELLAQLSVALETIRVELHEIHVSKCEQVGSPTTSAVLAIP